MLYNVKPSPITLSVITKGTVIFFGIFVSIAIYAPFPSVLDTIGLTITCCANPKIMPKSND